MPNLSHLWQRFLLSSALLVGFAVGVAATVFGYSNLGTVDVHWSVLHINGVPLWTVAVVPLAFILVAGTLYHWLDGLHHFTEHMRHRRRVHELEAEIASLRAHLDQVLEMPDHSGLPAKAEAKVSLPAPEEETLPPMVTEAPVPAVTALPEAESSVGKGARERTKRVKLTVAPEPAAEPAGEQANGEASTPQAEPAPVAPPSGA